MCLVDFLILNDLLFDIQIINENVYAITTCYVTLAFCFLKIHLCLLVSCTCLGRGLTNVVITCVQSFCLFTINMINLNLSVAHNVFFLSDLWKERNKYLIQLKFSRLNMHVH